MISKIIYANGWRAIALCQDDPNRGGIMLEVLAIRREENTLPDWASDRRYDSVENAIGAAKEWLYAQD